MNTAVLTATEFKATCLQVLDRLAARDLERVEVTKRGKVVAVLSSPERDRKLAESLFGSMRGTVMGLDGVDLTQPIFEGEIDAELGILHR